MLLHRLVQTLRLCAGVGLSLVMVSSLKHVDFLYCPILGRLAENNFVRNENIGRLPLE